MTKQISVTLWRPWLRYSIPPSPCLTLYVPDEWILYCEHYHDANVHHPGNWRVNMLNRLKPCCSDKTTNKICKISWLFCELSHCHSSSKMSLVLFSSSFEHVHPSPEICTVVFYSVISPNQECGNVMGAMYCEYINMHVVCMIFCLI